MHYWRRAGEGEREQVFVTSLNQDVRRFARACCRVCTGQSAENFAALRREALSMLDCGQPDEGEG